MMKVLFLSRYQFPIVKSGGTGVVVYELMKEITRVGITLEHWTWGSEGETIQQEIENMVGFAPLTAVGLPNIQLEKFFNVILTNLSMIKEFERLKDFDIVHVHTWELFLVGVIAKYLWNIPLVFTTHDIMKGDLPGEVHSTDIYAYGVLGERILATETDAVVPVSAENRILFEKFYPEVKGKSYVIPNGVNLESFKKALSRTVFEKHNIPLTEPYVLFIGRASEQKGIHHLVNAIKYLPSNIPIIFATSIRRWDGEEYHTTRYYLSLIRDIRKYRKNVYLVLNEWNRKLLSELYSYAAFTIMPSMYESCGMVLRATKNENEMAEKNGSSKQKKRGPRGPVEKRAAQSS